MSTLFISDLHLHPSRPAIIECFLTFLKQQRGQAEALYILGDLFETWIGDDNPEPAYQPVKSALKAFSNAGTPAYLMHGNRDFLLSGQFAAETGCSLLPDPTRIDFYGMATVLMHGDSLCNGIFSACRWHSACKWPGKPSNLVHTPNRARTRA